MDEKTLALLLRRILQEELKNYPTKEDLNKALSMYATKEDLHKMAEDFGSFVHDLVVTIDQKKADKEEVEKLVKRVTSLEDKEKRYIN